MGFDQGGARPVMLCGHTTWAGHTSGTAGVWGLLRSREMVLREELAYGGGVRSENKDKTVDFSPKYQRAEGVDLFCVTSLKAKRWELQKEDFGSPKDH